jgi:uncharacterized protein YbaR (Trm112 family)
MNKKIKLVSIALLFSMIGCASIDFGGDGLTYYDPKPYLFVTTTKDCVSTATVVLIPESKKSLVFKSGYGSAELSVTLTNGMITSAGQNTDTKIPETLTAIASLGTAAAGLKAKPVDKKQIICTPTARLYPIESGIPNLNKPISFSVSTKVVDLK